MSIPAAADQIGIGKKAFYSKMKDKSQFKQAEIKKLKELLSLSNERVSEIFLPTKFPKRNKGLKGGEKMEAEYRRLELLDKDMFAQPST